jgi:hypothetical protein
MQINLLEKMGRLDFALGPNLLPCMVFKVVGDVFRTGRFDLALRPFLM